MHIERSMFKEIDKYIPLANRVKNNDNGCCSVSCSECPFSRVNSSKYIYCGGAGSVFFEFGVDDYRDSKINDIFRDFIIMAETKKVKITW